MVEQLPEEFRPEVDNMVKTLEREYRMLRNDIYSESARVLRDTEGSPHQRKTIGLLMKSLKHESC